MNWVERQYAREQNLKDVATLWSDVYTAISSAVASWNKLYRQGQPQIEILDTEAHGHIQIACPTQSEGIVRISVNLNGDKFFAHYSSSLNNRTFHIDADHEAAFIKCGTERCDADEVSKRILEPALRPEKLGGPRSQRIL